jgi:hypothetical protein
LPSSREFPYKRQVPIWCSNASVYHPYRRKLMVVSSPCEPKAARALECRCPRLLVPHWASPCRRRASTVMVR